MDVKVPGANGNFIRIVDVWAGFATVTLAEAVVVHAVVFGLLFLLLSMADDSQALLHRPTERTNTNGVDTRAQPLLSPKMMYTRLTKNKPHHSSFLLNTNTFTLKYEI